MRESTKRLVCIVSVIIIFVGMAIGILIYKLTKEDNYNIGIDIVSEIEILKGETKKLGYNLYTEEAIVEATSSDRRILLVKEIKDKEIIVTGNEEGEVTLTVKASYKGERVEKKVAVKITEDASEERYKIELSNGKNYIQDGNIIYIQNSQEWTSIDVLIESKINKLPEENDTKISFDKEIEKEVKGNSITILPEEDCVMTITVEVASLNYKQEKQYLIKVE